MRQLLTLLLFLRCAAAAMAEFAPVTRSWQTEQGLPADKVNALAQTPDGYLWAGTAGGLARFDGVRFVPFGPKEGLPAVNIQQLLPDKEGRLWIVTTGAGIYWLRDGVISSVNLRETAPRGISDLVLASDGVVYGTTATGIIRYSEGKFSKEIVPYFVGRTRPSGLFAGRDGAIWARFSGKGLWRRKNGEWTQPDGLPEDLKSNVSALAMDSTGALWVGVRGNRVWRQVSGGWQEMTVQGVASGAYIQSLKVTKDGVAWLAVAGGGLWRSKEDTFLPVPLAEHGLSHSIEQLMLDAGGQLWAATLQHGLLRITDARVEACRIEEAGGAGLVRALCEVSPGEFAVGTMHHGAFRWKEGWSEPFDPDPAVAGYIFCNALLRTKDGTLWVGLGNGLHCYRNGKRVMDTAFNSQLIGDSVRALCEEPDGSVLAGCASGRVYRARNDKMEMIPGIGGAFIWALVRERPDVLWIAMRGRGVQRVGPDGITNYSAAQGLRSDLATALHLDTRGTLWVGTEGGGLACWRNGRFLSLGSMEGLPEDTVAQILDDGAGRLWLGGNKGIAGVEISEIEAVLEGKAQAVHPVLLGRADGMLSTACWPMVAVKASDGQLCFGTTRGFVRFHPPKPQAAGKIPRPKIEEVLVDNMVRAISLAGESLDLAPNTQHLEVRFTGLEVNEAENIRFRYRLAGLEKDWVESGTRRFASYALPPPGEYQFEVQASITPRQWSPQAATLKIVVPPRFWQTGWFAGAAMAVAVLMVGGAARALERRRAARRLAVLERQHAVDAERARIARDLHDDLGGSLTEMAMLSEVAQASLTDPEKARAHLDRIFTSAKSSARALDEIVWAADPGRDTLDSFVAYVGEFAQTFAANAGLRCRIDVPSKLPAVTLSAPVRHHLYLAVKEALNNVAKHAAAREVRLGVAVDGGRLRVSVEDDGRGFDQKTERGPGANGLVNMERRLAEIGGSFDLRTAPGRRTLVEYSLPLDQLGQ